MCPTIWVQEDANELVSHRYNAWFIWFDGDLLGPLLEVSRPPRAANDNTPNGNAEGP